MESATAFKHKVFHKVKMVQLVNHYTYRNSNEPIRFWIGSFKLCFISMLCILKLGVLQFAQKLYVEINHEVGKNVSACMQSVC